MVLLGIDRVRCIDNCNDLLANEGLVNTRFIPENNKGTSTVAFICL